mmetsp:Transcript_39533/g.51028  ORF Transcript_39533/g.51028 Transcript_39533/m.51028 type:complete len:135 (+) Transcript_39533:149-553(+)
MEETKSENAREYDSNFESETEEEAPEIIENMVPVEDDNPSENVWTEVQSAIEVETTHEEFIWDVVKPRVFELTKNISHAIWMTDTGGWRKKVKNKEFSWANKKKAKWDGRTCWEVWHEDVELPKLKCAENSKCT